MNKTFQSFLIFISLIFCSTVFMFKFTSTSFMTLRAFILMPYLMFMFAIGVLLFKSLDIDHDLIEVYDVQNIKNLEEL